MVKEMESIGLKDRNGNAPIWHMANNGCGQLPHEVYSDPTRKQKLTPTEIGCFASHYEIWKRIVSENLVRVLIMEDDNSFGHNFAKTLESLPDYDYFNFTHAAFGSSSQYHREPSGLPGISKGYGFWFTNCYAITSSTAKLFLEKLAVQTDSVDYQILLLQKDLNSFCCVPSVVTQNTRRFKSTIIHTKNDRKK